jgi:2-polyprenyl-3-methyl-5-hydroxy-6-metoxy-1,4-benzoquinol methylase
MRTATSKRRRKSRAKTAVTAARACWCGNTVFEPFGSDYGVCRDCETLVYLKEVGSEQFLVRDDETDFYGKKYWLEYQQDAHGYVNIHTRARRDLIERNLYWLRALLKFCLPPATVLELGCGHGSFVALLRQTGYEASGVEMSPWVVTFGRETFGVPVQTGPVESLDLPAASLDAICLMDVLEHLPDPMATMRHCLELLKPEGFLLVQTPCFKVDKSYEELAKSKDVFLEQLKPREHLYIFSESSAAKLFQQLGAKHIRREPAIFAHYDMFFAVSRSELPINSQQVIESSLLATPSRRFALALLDLSVEELNHESGERFLQFERNLLQSQLAELQQKYEAAEEDRVARGAVIEQQGQVVSGLEANIDAQLKEFAALLERTNALQHERNLLQSQLAELQQKYEAAEEDRVVLGKLVDEQVRQLGKIPKLESEVKSLSEENNGLRSGLDAILSLPWPLGPFLRRHLDRLRIPE